MQRIDIPWMRPAVTRLSQITGLSFSVRMSRFSSCGNSSLGVRSWSAAQNTYILEAGEHEYLIHWTKEEYRSPRLIVRRKSGDSYVAFAKIEWPDYDYRGEWYAHAPLDEVVGPILRDLIERGIIPRTAEALITAGLASDELKHLHATKAGIERKIAELVERSARKAELDAKIQAHKAQEAEIGRLRAQL